MIIAPSVSIAFIPSSMGCSFSSPISPSPPVLSSYLPRPHTLRLHLSQSEQVCTSFSSYPNDSTASPIESNPDPLGTSHLTSLKHPLATPSSPHELYGKLSEESSLLTDPAKARRKSRSSKRKPLMVGPSIDGQTKKLTKSKRRDPFIVNENKAIIAHIHPSSPSLPASSCVTPSHHSRSPSFSSQPTPSIPLLPSSSVGLDFSSFADLPHGRLSLAAAQIALMNRQTNHSAGQSPRKAEARRYSSSSSSESASFSTLPSQPLSPSGTIGTGNSLPTASTVSSVRSSLPRSGGLMTLLTRSSFNRHSLSPIIIPQTQLSAVPPVGGGLASPTQSSPFSLPSPVISSSPPTLHSSSSPIISAILTVSSNNALPGQNTRDRSRLSRCSLPSGCASPKRNLPLLHSFAATAESSDEDHDEADALIMGDLTKDSEALRRLILLLQEAQLIEQSTLQPLSSNLLDYDSNVTQISSAALTPMNSSFRYPGSLPINNSPFDPLGTVSSVAASGLSNAVAILNPSLMTSTAGPIIVQSPPVSRRNSSSDQKSRSRHARATLEASRKLERLIIEQPQVEKK
jgi:hypothetical protein